MMRSVASTPGWDHGRYCDALATEVARFVDAIDGADLGRAVPTCPGWDIAELVRHLGSVHRWAAAMVRDRATERLRREDLDLELPADGRDPGAWLSVGGDALVATLRRADPDAPMWAWGADQHVRFWPRRMVHETAVHRADAALALGTDVDTDIDIDIEVATDAIDELLDNLPHARPFAPDVVNLRGAGESLVFEASDCDARWLVHLTPEGFRWTRAAEGEATAHVRAPAHALLLLLYRRLPVADAAFTPGGDEAVLSRWLENSAL
jgi:uncharacterized protein (TIGR03083 family)